MQHNPTDRGGVGVDGDPPGGELLDVVAAGGGQAWVQPVELLPVLVPLDAVDLEELRIATIFLDPASFQVYDDAVRMMSGQF